VEDGENTQNSVFHSTYVICSFLLYPGFTEINKKLVYSAITKGYHSNPKDPHVKHIQKSASHKMLICVILISRSVSVEPDFLVRKEDFSMVKS